VSKITYYGSEKEISKAVQVIEKRKSLKRMGEAKARLKIQELIDQYKLKANILINGNQVWSKTQILRNLKRLMKHGQLYNRDQSKKPVLSNYFYSFLHLCCGSVAHYDIYGWIHKYPTIEHLRQFFLKNEFGKRVLDDIPEWKTDVHVIVVAIEKMLFPFKTYMETRQITNNH